MRMHFIRGTQIVVVITDHVHVNTMPCSAATAVACVEGTDCWRHLLVVTDVDSGACVYITSNLYEYVR